MKLSKLHIYSKMKKKKHVMYLDIYYVMYYKHLLYQITKNIVQEFIHMKNKFGKKDIQSFSKVIMLVHYISFAPIL
jgi:hypothetical protein